MQVLALVINVLSTYPLLKVRHYPAILTRKRSFDAGDLWLINGSNSGYGRGGDVAYPLLLECDLEGQVLWMSDLTRSTLGDPRNLVETFLAEIPAPGGRFSILRFWRVWKNRGSVLIGAQAAETAWTQVLDEASAWRAIEGRLLRNYFRLEIAQRVLSSRAPERRTNGRSAIRQIEMERQRLGRELHTGVGQMLTAIHLQVEIVEAQLPTRPAPVEQALKRISSLAGDALDQVRAVSRRLHPPEWQRLTLEAALQQLWERSGIPETLPAAVLDIQPLNRQPDLEIKILLYRAAQEALSNLRHSGATTVEMRLAERRGSLVLTVHDDGVGFDVERLFSAPPNAGSGIGLRTIREQANTLGGKLVIQSGPGSTTLEISASVVAAESGFRIRNS
jgi:signal transduction histidine kinase